jgi:hypothetical protein
VQTMPDPATRSRTGPVVDRNARGLSLRINRLSLGSAITNWTYSLPIQVVQQLAVLLKNSNLFNYNELCNISKLSLKNNYLGIFGRNQHGKILHLAVTANPHSQWAIQQLRETFAFDETTKYVIRDNDNIFSEDFKLHIRNFGLEDTPTAPRNPWQNPHLEGLLEKNSEYPTDLSF